MQNWAQYPVRMVLALILLVGGIYAGYRAFFPDLPLVGIIQWTKEIKPFEDSLQGVIEGLREEGHEDGLNIRLELRNAAGERDKVAAAARDFQERGARLLVTVGTVPTLIALEATKIPIVYTTVGAPNATGLSRPAAGKSMRFTGTSMEVPIQEQLRFLLLARPGLKRLGILFCNATPQAVATGEKAEQLCSSLSLKPILRTVTDERPELLEQTLAGLLAEKIDALFIPTDPVLGKPKNLQIICDVALRACIPVMVPEGTSMAYGALLSYHCDFTDVGRQSGRQAARLLHGTPMEQVPPESPDIRRLTINLKVAQRLNLHLSRQLLCQAYHLYQ
ncbi:MAG: ABC transporter substrate-binding protein [Thermodesulfobacteriota bacterium]